MSKVPAHELGAPASRPIRLMESIPVTSFAAGSGWASFSSKTVLPCVGRKFFTTVRGAALPNPNPRSTTARSSGGARWFHFTGTVPAVGQRPKPHFWKLSRCAASGALLSVLMWVIAVRCGRWKRRGKSFENSFRGSMFSLVVNRMRLSSLKFPHRQPVIRHRRAGNRACVLWQIALH